MMKRENRREQSGLPEEKTFQASAPRLFTTLVLTLAILVSVNWAVIRIQRKSAMNLGYWLIDKKWSMLEELERPVDTLVLGDSSGNQAAIPEVLDRFLGGRSVNLCSVANLLVLNDVWMLNRYIGRFGAPKRVVLIHTYDIWNRPLSREAMMRMPLRWGFWDRLDPPIPFQARQRWEFFLNRYVPMYSQNKSVGEWLMRPWVWKDAFSLTENGFMDVAKAQPHEVRKDSAGHRRFVRAVKFGLSSRNRQALRVMAGLAEKHGFDVYLAHAPIHDELAKDGPFREYFAALQGTLERFVKDHPRVHLVFSEPPAYPADQMTNSDHLTRQGARHYSELLAAAVAAYR